MTQARSRIVELIAMISKLCGFVTLAIVDWRIAIGVFLVSIGVLLLFAIELRALARYAEECK